MDFSEILQNEHKGYEHENLYVFGKDVALLERNGTETSAYILFQVSRKRIGGNHYDREGEKRFLHSVQERDRVPFAEEEHRKAYKG